jgi:uncharacterized protein (TIGR00251 family)
VGAAVTTRLQLRVSPGARRPEIAGRYGGGWRVRVAEPPERGRAHDGVLRLLASTLGVDVRLVSGHASRDKVVAFELDAAEAERLLSAAVGKERE